MRFGLPQPLGRSADVLSDGVQLGNIRNCMTDHMNMRFHAGLKEAAQRIADKEHGGNLRAYINALVLRDVQRRKKAKA